MQVATDITEANRRIDALLDALEKHHNDNMGHMCEVCGMSWETYTTSCLIHDSCGYVDVVGSRRNGWLPKACEGELCRSADISRDGPESDLDFQFREERLRKQCK